MISGHLCFSHTGITGSRNKTRSCYRCRRGKDHRDVGRESPIGGSGMTGFESGFAGLAGFEVCRWQGRCLRSTENVRKGTGWEKDKVW